MLPSCAVFASLQPTLFRIVCTALLTAPSVPQPRPRRTLVHGHASLCVPARGVVQPFPARSPPGLLRSIGPLLSLRNATPSSLRLGSAPLGSFVCRLTSCPTVCQPLASTRDITWELQAVLPLRFGALAFLDVRFRLIRLESHMCRDIAAISATRLLTD